MSVSSVSNYTSNAVTGNNTTLSGSETSLSMDDFFTLLAAELQNQNALDPVSNTEFISQMAQFSVLSQMKQMSNSVQMGYAASLIGKNVTVSSTDTNGNTTTASGIVSAINISSGTAYLKIGSNSYALSSLTSVTNPESTSSSTNTSGASNTTGT